MKKITLTMLGTALLFSTSALAQEQSVKGYASIKAVATKTESNFWGNKEKFHPKGANIAIGMKVNKNLRFEAEYGYREKSDKTEAYTEVLSQTLFDGVEKMELSTQSYMLNGYYDFHNTSRFTPYVGIGAGMAKVKYDYSDSYDAYDSATGFYLGSDRGTYQASKTKFAYSISAGASYDIDNHLALDLGLRYVDYGSFSDADGDKYKTKSKEVTFGLRYSF